jgi:hypothetical protein
VQPFIPTPEQLLILLSTRVPSYHHRSQNPHPRDQRNRPTERPRLSGAFVRVAEWGVVV